MPSRNEGGAPPRHPADLLPVDPTDRAPVTARMQIGDAQHVRASGSGVQSRVAPSTAESDAHDTIPTHP